MKRMIAFLAACGCLVSFCSCSADKEAPMEDTIVVETHKSEATETSAEVQSTKETTKETVEESAETADASDGIVLAEASGIFVPEVGNYETYLDNFTFPEKYIMQVGLQDGYQMTLGTADDVTLFQMNFRMADEETGDDTAVEYAFYSNDTDAYVFMSADSEDKSECNIQHAPVKASEETAEENEAMNSFDWSSSDVTYVEYLGEQEWEGKTYDTISAEMKKEEETVPATFWFTKEGEFVKADFVGEDKSMGFIQAVSSISMPDTSNLEVEEVDSEDIAMSMLGAIMMFAFSGMDSGLNNETAAEE